MTEIPRLNNIIAVIIIILLGFAVYANSLANGFVYDDELVVNKNPFISSFKNLKHLFTGYYFAGSGEFTYRPMVTLTYMIDSGLWESNPFGYHLTNVFIHLLNGVLLYFLLQRLVPMMTKNIDPSYTALLGSILFLIHPVQTEVVNGIGFREDALVTAFIFAAIIFYLKAYGTNVALKKIGGYLASISFFVLSLLSKEWGVVLMAVIPLIDIYTSDSGWKKRLVKQIPYYAAYGLVLTVYITFFLAMMRGQAIKIGIKTDISIYRDIILAGSRYIAYYIKLLFAPFDLSVEYLFPKVYSISEPSVFLSILTIMAITLLVSAGFNRNRVMSFSGAWVLALTGPLILFPYQPIAERFLYLPCAGFSLFIAALFTGYYDRLKHKKWPVIIPLAFLITFYCSQTVTRNAAWKDPATFWEDRLRRSVGTARAYSSLGDEYLAKGLLDKAEWAYKNALTVDDRYADAHNNLGSLYAKKGLTDKAIAEFEKALELKPGFIASRYNLAKAYGHKGLYEKALTEYDNIIKEQPFHAPSYNNMGSLYLKQGMNEKALEKLEKAVEIAPDLMEAHYNLGVIYLNLGLYEKAKREFETVLKLKPGYPQALKHMEEMKRSGR
ncbi:MAG: tetratricopeptide repeat protein [Candidatus Omnitrophica bacterium]|nr:tetratricopeptide repeat protein [Candidatus Omnitrophota bacterium]